MIGHLRGTILEKTPNRIVLDAGGVGYEVLIPISTYTALPNEGASAALRIFTHVREDTLALFGFATFEEKSLFERLISVSGIGPKLGLQVLSGLATADLVAAIRGGDVARLVRIPGVGKKTAERIVLELKERMTGVDVGPHGVPMPRSDSGLSGMENDILSALQNLGCSRAAAEEAIRKVKERGAPDSFEPFFRQALALVR